MNKKLFDRMVTNGIHDMFQSIVNDPKRSKERTSLLKNSMVSLSGCGTVTLYVDNSYLPIADKGPRVKEVSPESLFAVLRTPVADFTISSGALYEVTFKPENMHGKMPDEVNLELVLEEVDRVAFTDSSFDSMLAVRSPKFSKPKSNDIPLEWRGMGRGSTLIDRARVAIETVDGRRLDLEPQSIEVTERVEPSFPGVTTWGGSSIAQSVQLGIHRDRVIEITAHMGRV